MWFHIMQIGLHWAQLATTMASTEWKISKLGAAGTIPETLEIIRKPGSATSQSVIMEAYKIGLLTIRGIRKHKKVLFDKWNI